MKNKKTEAMTYTFLATVIGFTLIGDLDYIRQNSLGNFLYLIAQILETNSAIQESIETPKKQNKASNEQNKDIIDELIKDIDIIKNKLSEYTLFICFSLNNTQSY